VRGVALAVVVAGLALGAAGPASAARPLTTGFTDGVFGGDAATSGPWLDRAVAADARLVLLSIDWASVAARKPAVPEDPADPAYDWSASDAAVRAAQERGLQIGETVAYAPAWAEGPRRARNAPPGTWRPNAAAFGAFMAAAAKRYPQVRFWQPWSEPNLFTHLQPQWSGRTPASPAIYRGLLNAAYAAVKRVAPSAEVVTAGTAPFGDTDPRRGRVPPARFVRELLCLRGQALRPERCPGPAHFDALAHHPYSVGAPGRHALNVDDVSVPDLGKLTRPLRAAERSGRALPRGHKALWVTEFSWDSRPPDPQGVPVARQARWLEEALYSFWRQGVDVATWFNIRDQAPTPSYATTYQSGVYYRNGRPKPSLRAFRFPFVVSRISARRVRAWCKVPVGGQLHILRRVGGTWRVVTDVHVYRGEVVVHGLYLRGPGTLRAQVAGDTSLAFRVG